MKKKMLPLIMVVCLMAGILAGCGQAEGTTGDANVSSDIEVVVENDSEEIEKTEVVSEVEQCIEEKICSHYTVDDLPYSVCDDCYASFAEANGLPKH